MKSYLSEAIWKLCPGAEFSYENDEYSTIKWSILEGNAPTQEEIDSAIELVKQEEAEAIAEAATKRQALLEKLGITEEEAKLLLG